MDEESASFMGWSIKDTEVSKLEAPICFSKNDYITLYFEIKDPITGYVFKNYVMTESALREEPREIQRALLNFRTSDYFNETEYSKLVEKYKLQNKAIMDYRTKRKEELSTPFSDITEKIVEDLIKEIRDWDCLKEHIEKIESNIINSISSFSILKNEK